MDRRDILIENLREALRQLQRYLSLAIGTSLSLLLLQLAKPQSSQQTALFGFTLPVNADPSIAKFLLNTAHIVLAILVLTSADHAKKIAATIDNPHIRNAAAAFPTIATSADAWLRVIGVMVPALLYLGFLVAHAWSHWSNKDFDGGLYYLGFLIGVLPYVASLFELRQLRGC